LILGQLVVEGDNVKVKDASSFEYTTIVGNFQWKNFKIKSTCGGKNEPGSKTRLYLFKKLNQLL
jgi:hypothetical protein